MGLWGMSPGEWGIEIKKLWNKMEILSSPCGCGGFLVLCCEPGMLWLLLSAEAMASSHHDHTWDVCSLTHPEEPPAAAPSRLSLAGVLFSGHLKHSRLLERARSSGCVDKMTLAPWTWEMKAQRAALLTWHWSR